MVLVKEQREFMLVVITFGNGMAMNMLSRNYVVFITKQFMVYMVVK